LIFVPADPTVPAFGLCLTTLADRAVKPFFLVTLPSLQPAPRELFLAPPSLFPFRFGTLQADLGGTGGGVEPPAGPAQPPMLIGPSGTEGAASPSASENVVPLSSEVACRLRGAGHQPQHQHRREEQTSHRRKS
jgi:hypothetical protein